MTKLSEYIIPYLGLSNGAHKYAFNISRDFWKHFEMSKISDGEMLVNVVFDKLDRVVTLEIYCEGTYMADCDRCTARIVIPMVFQDRMIIKVTDERLDQKEEVIFMDVKTSHIDIAPMIYESIHVHLPMVNVKDCKTEDYKDCDHSILDRLENSEAEEEVDSEKGKSIWSELDKLNLK